MSDIRFNRWLHQSGTGGVYQDGSGRVGIGSSTPTDALDIVGVASATSFFGPLTGDVTSSGTSTFDVISGVSTIGVTTVHLTAINDVNYPTAGPLSNRNLIVNGGMTFSQRSTSETGVNDAGYKSLDRMRYSENSLGTTVITHEQSTDAPDGFANSLKVTVTTAEGSVGAADGIRPIEYRIEGQDLQHLAYGTSSAKSLTLSFYVKSSVTGTYSIAFYRDESTDRQITDTYTISSANTWEYKTITIPGDTGASITNDNANRFAIYFHAGAGSDWTSTDSSGSWGDYAAGGFAYGNAVNLQNTLNATWQATGLQLETGSVATPFEHRSYGDELARCQRYYYKLIADTGDTFCNGYNQNTRNTRNILHFPVTMRVAPTALEQTGTAANYRILHGTTENACSGVPIFLSATTNTAEIQADTGSGLTAGQGNALESNSNGTYLAFPAEL